MPNPRARRLRRAVTGLRRQRKRKYRQSDRRPCNGNTETLHHWGPPARFGLRRGGASNRAQRLGLKHY